jgi:hypothetical protein
VASVLVFRADPVLLHGRHDRISGADGSGRLPNSRQDRFRESGGLFVYTAEIPLPVILVVMLAVAGDPWRAGVEYGVKAANIGVSYLSECEAWAHPGFPRMDVLRLISVGSSDTFVLKTAIVGQTRDCMKTAGRGLWSPGSRAAWLVLAVLLAFPDRSVEAGCGDHSRVFVGDVFGVKSLDLPPDVQPNAPPRPPGCSGPQCSRMPASPVSTSPPTGRVLEAWACLPEGVVIGPKAFSSSAVPAPASLPIHLKSDLFRPPR